VNGGLTLEYFCTRTVKDMKTYNNNNNNNNTLDRFATKDSYTWNITHNTESTAV